MPAPAVAAGVAKAVKVVWSDIKSNDGSLIKAAVCIILAALILLSSLLYYMSPLSILHGISLGSLGQFEEDENGRYLVPEDDERFPARVVSHYEEEAKELEAWAKGRWSSGSDDVYVLPDWRWLWALDATLAGNDYSKVTEDPAYYEDFHRSLLSGLQRTRIETHVMNSYVNADGSAVEEDDPGAIFDEVTGTYFVESEQEVSITFWEVKHRSYKDIFTSTAANITDELFYYMHFESGAFGAGWGDLGNALGAFQFDRRYALPPFISFCYSSDPQKYSMLEPWSKGGIIAQGDTALEAAWMAAYEKDPEDFTRLQYEYEIEHYCKPAWDIMARYGIDMEDRRDAVKGLVAGLCNAMGQGGLEHGIARLTLSATMTDLELARAICAGIYNSADLGADWMNPGKNVYLEAFHNRYRNELATIEALLALPPETGGERRGDAYSLLQLDIANNYAKAVRYVTIEDRKVIFDRRGYVTYMSSGSGLSFGADTDAQQRVATAALSGDMFGKGKNGCEGWTEEVYRHAGFTVPRMSCARESCWTYAVSNDMDNVPLGAAVYAGESYVSGVRCGGHDAGHSGVYVGDGMIASNETGNSITLRSVESWIQFYRGGSWGWMGGIDLTLEP